jgi:hypothetical protein
MGWNTLGAEQTNGIDSDLTILNERLIKNGLPSIVGYNSKGFPFIESHSHVDPYRGIQKYNYQNFGIQQQI